MNRFQKIVIDKVSIRDGTLAFLAGRISGVPEKTVQSEIVGFSITRYDMSMIFLFGVKSCNMTPNSKITRNTRMESYYIGFWRVFESFSYLENFDISSIWIISIFVCRDFLFSETVFVIKLNEHFIQLKNIGSRLAGNLW
jgi:hypothetical protein